MNSQMTQSNFEINHVTPSSSTDVSKDGHLRKALNCNNNQLLNLKKLHHQKGTNVDFPHCRLQIVGGYHFFQPNKEVVN